MPAPCAVSGSVAVASGKSAGAGHDTARVRTRRHTPPGPQRAVVFARPGPILTVPNDTLDWCDAHHLRHWANGGPTDLNNTVLLCPRHHHTAHHQNWTIRIAADGLPEFTPPPWIDPEQHPRRHHRHKPPPHPRQ